LLSLICCRSVNVANLSDDAVKSERAVRARILTVRTDERGKWPPRSTSAISS
jgi:hypothetical protein